MPMGAVTRRGQQAAIASAGIFTKPESRKDFQNPRFGGTHFVAVSCVARAKNFYIFPVPLSVLADIVGFACQFG